VFANDRESTPPRANRSTETGLQSHRGDGEI
jgi:hypothetical protein